MPEKIEIEQLKRRLSFLKEEYPQLCPIYDTYISYSKKMKFIDEKYGEWWVTPKNLVNKRSKHRKRRDENRKITPIQIIKKRLFNVWKDEIKIIDDTYCGLRKKAIFIDKKYGKFEKVVWRVLNGGASKKRGIETQMKKSIINIEEIKRRLYSVWGDMVSIVENTYIKYSEKATFVDKRYGKWDAIVGNVLKGHGHPDGSLERQKETSRKHYGKDFAIQNLEVFKKIEKSCWASHTIYHWKTNQPINIRGSFQWAVVDKLNKDRIDFQWQIPFNIEINNKERIYFCDLYLIKQNKYIEIKGVFKSQINKLKWQIFHKTHENSELWKEKQVCKFVGESKYKFYKRYKNEFKN